MLVGLDRVFALGSGRRVGVVVVHAATMLLI